MRQLRAEVVPQMAGGSTGAAGKRRQIIGKRRTAQRLLLHCRIGPEGRRRRLGFCQPCQLRRQGRYLRRPRQRRRRHYPGPFDQLAKGGKDIGQVVRRKRQARRIEQDRLPHRADVQAAGLQGGNLLLSLRNARSPPQLLRPVPAATAPGRPVAPATGWHRTAAAAPGRPGWPPGTAGDGWRSAAPATVPPAWRHGRDSTRTAHAALAGKPRSRPDDRRGADRCGTIKCGWQAPVQCSWFAPAVLAAAIRTVFHFLPHLFPFFSPGKW